MKKVLFVLVLSTIGARAALIFPPGTTGGSGSGGGIGTLNGVGTNALFYNQFTRIWTNDPIYRYDGGSNMLYAGAGSTNYVINSWMMGNRPYQWNESFDKDAVGDQKYGGWQWDFIHSGAASGPSPINSEFKMYSQGRLAFAAGYPTFSGIGGYLQIGANNIPTSIVLNNQTNINGSSTLGNSGAVAFQTSLHTSGGFATNQYPGIFGGSVATDGTDYAMYFTGELYTNGVGNLDAGAWQWNVGTIGKPIMELHFQGRGVPYYTIIPGLSYFGVNASNPELTISPSTASVQLGENNHGNQLYMKVGDGSGNNVFRIGGQGSFQGIYFNNYGVHIGSPVTATAGMNLEVVGGNAALSGTAFMTNGYTSYATNIGITSLTTGFTNSVGTNGRNGTNDMWCLVTATSGTLTYYNRSGTAGQTACGVASAARTLTSGTFTIPVEVNCGFTIASPVGVIIEPFAK